MNLLIYPPPKKKTEFFSLKLDGLEDAKLDPFTSLPPTEKSCPASPSVIRQLGGLFPPGNSTTII